MGKVNYKAYLGKMQESKIVHFVCFETTLDSDRFTKRWEEYNRSAQSDLDVTIQQSEKNGMFNYVAQHRCIEGELQFVFTKPARSSRIPQIGIKTIHAGGYSILQTEKKNDAHADESKVFAFLIQPKADLNIYRQLTTHSKLNIYGAYYENCRYAYILEFFVKNKYTAELLEQLNHHDVKEVGVYKECVLAPAV
jgi:hypothetical protein